MTDKKMTKKDYYNVIKEFMADNAEVVEFCNKEIAALDAKAAKAKARAQAKAAAGDALTDAIANVLTEEPKTLAEIVEAIGDENVTPNKISARASKLAEAGKAVKVEVVVDKRKLVAYAAPEAN